MKQKNNLQKILTFAAVLLAVQLCIVISANAYDYAIGADLSFLKQTEDSGTEFKYSNEPKPGLQIFKDHGYNWKLAEYRNKLTPFLETPEGQKKLLKEVNRIVLNTPNNRKKGIFWWEPAVPRSSFRSGGTFDDNGNALFVITVFDKLTRHQFMGIRISRAAKSTQKYEILVT
jgi:arabinogalactan endo-1,4-beta-galactosidase